MVFSPVCVCARLYQCMLIQGMMLLFRDFAAGAALYPLVELVWRGRTHPVMALAGGASLCTLRRLNTAMKNRPLWQASLLGGMSITGIEYLCGRLFNRRYQIWDYRRTPLNLHGQICAPYTAAWCALSAAALGCMRLKAYSSLSRI